MKGRRFRPEKLNPGHFHEAMDRAHVLSEMFDACIVRHPAIVRTKALRSIANDISSKMAELYQLAGALYFESSEKRK